MNHYRTYILSSLLLCAAFGSFSGNAAAYCISKGNSSTYEWIQSTNIAGVSRVSGNNMGYANFFQPVINLNAGANSIALTAGGSFSEYWKIWIDFNNNDDFGTDEVVYSGSGRILNGSIAIPTTAASGERGMRISMKYGSSPLPCGNFPYGEVEDYRVYLNTVDTIAPTVASTAPAAGAVDVPVSTTVTVNFSENLQPSSVGDSSISLSSNGVPVAGAVSLNGKVAVFIPSARLEHSSTYLVTVHAGVLDLSGNALAQDATWSFTTVAPDVTAPAVTQSTPPHGATDVPISQVIQAVFSEPLDPPTVNASTVLVSNASGNIAGNVSLSADRKSALFHPLQPLAYLTAYTATITSGVTDESGNALPSDHVWSFTTLEYQPTYCTSWAGNPTHMWISGVKVGNQTRTSVSSNYSDHTATLFQADRTIPQPLTLTPAYKSYVYTPYWKVFIDWNQDGVFGNADVAYTGIGNPANWNIYVPEQALSGNTRMRVTLQYGNYASSACGALTYGEVEDYRINVPAPAADTTPPTVTSTSPAGSAQNVLASSVVFANFSEAMYAATVNAQSFTLSSASGQVTAQVSYDAQNKRAVLTPAAALAWSTIYTATLSGLEDLAGNALSDYSWSFTTQAEPPPVYSVSGKVLRDGAGVSDVEVQLMGNTTRITTTDSSGSYSVTGLVAGSYRIMPIKGGYNFTPSIQWVSVVNASVTAPDISAQIYPGHVVNGDFETGDFSGFTLFETSSGHMVESVATFATRYGDIPSRAARFYVGNNGTNQGYSHGGGIYQTVNLKAGDLYASMNLASSYINDSTSCLVQVYFDGELVATHDFGSISAGSVEYQTLSFSKPGITAGGHELRILLTRTWATTSLACYIDDILLTGSSTQ